jgi:D-xylose reductase
VQRGTAVIPKTLKVERLQENIAIFDFNLSNSEMDSISSLNKSKRFADIGTVLE